MTLEQDIQKWVYLDNQLKTMNDSIKDIREKKNKYGENIINYVKTHNKTNSVIQITDGLLKFHDTTIQQSLTFKYLESCLNDLFEKNEVNRIIAHVKNKRESNKQLDIKRFRNK